MYTGLFSSPAVLFPSKKEVPSTDKIGLFGGLLSVGDLLTDTAIVSGTRYKIGQIVVTSVACSDLITVGVIIQPVIRRSSLMFIVSKYEAVRTSFSFWQACPSHKVDIIDQKDLSDFKPLYKRDTDECFRFVLHHHLPTPLD